MDVGATRHRPHFGSCSNGKRSGSSVSRLSYWTAKQKNASNSLIENDYKYVCTTLLGKVRLAASADLAARQDQKVLSSNTTGLAET